MLLFVNVFNIVKCIKKQFLLLMELFVFKKENGKYM